MNLKHFGCFFFFIVCGTFAAQPLSCCWSLHCCCSCLLRRRGHCLLRRAPAAEPHLLSTERFQQWTSAKRLTHLTMISHERPHIATASLCPPPTCILASGKVGCRCARIKHGDNRDAFGPGKGNGNGRRLGCGGGREFGLSRCFLQINQSLTAVSPFGF